MRVLVTGGGGFAGKHLLREILSAGPEYVAATVLGDPPEFPPDDQLASVEWLSLELDSEDSIRAALRECRPDAIYHLAGQASVGQSLDQPIATWDVNATGTLRLLVALQQIGRPARLLLASSAEVYGSVPAGEQPISETLPMRPLTPYGASKAGAEIIALQTCAAGGIDVVVARSFNHIGPGQDQRFVLRNMALQLAAIRRGERDPLLRAGNLDVERDFLDVRDAVKGYAVLMGRGESGQRYNISSGRALSLQTIVERLVELSGTEARVEVDPRRMRPIDIPLLVGDAGRLRALGWQPTYDLDVTLRDLLDEAESSV